MMLRLESWRPLVVAVATAAAFTLATSTSVQADSASTSRPEVPPDAATPYTATSTPAAGHIGRPSTTPRRVLIVLFDQLRPEYVSKFGLKNIAWVQNHGAKYTHSTVGYTGAVTVVSHNVIVSGQYPKHMGWMQETYRDADNLLGGGAGKMWMTTDLSLAQFETIENHQGYQKLSDYLHRSQPGSKVITVGEKSYAVESAAAGTSDIAVRMSSKVKDGSCPAIGEYRGPVGRAVPSYLAQPACGRYYINSASDNDYGTGSAFPSWLYPEDGNHYFPGNDPAHLGGDAWVADAAMSMMGREKWSGMFVTLGGIDKAGHMWGANHDKGVDRSDASYPTHVPEAAKVADAQLGRMISRLRSLDQLKDTLIVLTADHGGTYGANFYGSTDANRADLNTYYGETVNRENFDSPSPSLAPLIATGNVKFSLQSTVINAWLKDTSGGKQLQAAKAVRKLPGVMAVYRRVGNHYVLVSRGAMSAEERRWWKRNAQRLLNTSASPAGPDVVGLLHNNTSYSLYGDHGAPSKDDQRIPISYWSAGMAPTISGRSMRNVDILPTILKAMQIPQTGRTDGVAVKLPIRRGVTGQR